MLGNLTTEPDIESTVVTMATEGEGVGSGREHEGLHDQSSDDTSVMMTSSVSVAVVVGVVVVSVSGAVVTIWLCCRARRRQETQGSFVYTVVVCSACSETCLSSFAPSKSLKSFSLVFQTCALFHLHISGRENDDFNFTDNKAYSKSTLPAPDSDIIKEENRTYTHNTRLHECADVDVYCLLKEPFAKTTVCSVPELGHMGQPCSSNRLILLLNHTIRPLSSFHTHNTHTDTDTAEARKKPLMPPRCYVRDNCAYGSSDTHSTSEPPPEPPPGPYYSNQYFTSGDMAREVVDTHDEHVYIVDGNVYEVPSEVHSL